MDPFSGVTALVPIALVLFNAGHKLKGFLRELRNAPDDVHQFMNEMIFYSRFLERFHTTVHESGHDLQPDEDAERQELVEHVVDQATVVMKGVEVIIPIFEAVHADKNLSSASFMTRLKWYSKKSEVAHLRRCLAEAKLTAQLLLSMFNYDLSQRNSPNLQTILRPNQLPRSLQRALPENQPRPRVGSSAVHLLPADTERVSETDSTIEDDRHDSIAKIEKSEAAKRSTRKQILSWLGLQQHNDKKGEDEESDDDDAEWHRYHERYRDSSPAPSTSALSPLESSADGDGTRKRPPEGRPGLASRLKNAIRSSQARRKSRLTRSASEFTSSLDSNASSLSSAARTPSVRSAVNRDSRQRPSRLRTNWPFRQRQSQKVNKSHTSFDFYASDSSD